MELVKQADVLQAQGKPVIHLSIGEPDFPMPGPVQSALMKAIAENKTCYTPALGLPELRLAISKHYQSAFGVQVPAGQIVITSGASAGFEVDTANLQNGNEFSFAYVQGGVSKTNQGDKAQFDMKMLEKLPQKSFTTQTPWYPNAVTFTGPLLRDVLAAVGAKGTKITAVALNDYKTEIPLEDATRHDVIVARLMNNRPMPVREKGPLFIVYPFDTKAELRSELYYNRAAWQLNALRIR